MLRFVGAVWSCLLTGCVPELTSAFAPVDCDPSANQWAKASQEPELYAEGFAQGQVVPDFCLDDQEAAPVQLWQFHGQVVALDVSTIWCAPCQALAQGTEETWQHYRDDGFTYVTLLAENLAGEDPTQADLQSWASNFGITAPIVGDPARGYSGPLVPDNAFPVLYVIGRDSRVHRRVVPATDEALREAIEEAL